MLWKMNGLWLFEVRRKGEEELNVMRMRMLMEMKMEKVMKMVLVMVMVNLLWEMVKMREVKCLKVFHQEERAILE